MDNVTHLTAPALELLNKKLDGFGTTRGWFVDLRDLRRISNKLAGGPGLSPGRIHYLHRDIVTRGQKADSLIGELTENAKKEVESIGAVESVFLRCVINGEDPTKVLEWTLQQAKRKEYLQEEMSPREHLAYRVLERGENLNGVLEEMGVDVEVVEARLADREEYLSDAAKFALRVAKGADPTLVFNELGITQEVVDKAFLVRPLTVEELNLIVCEDGGMESCPLCEDDDEKFQPVVARNLRNDLSEVADSSIITDEFFAGDDKGLWTTGSFLVIKNDSGNFDMAALHGPVVKIQGFSGKNHLYQARKGLGEVQFERLKRRNRTKPGETAKPDHSLGRAQAQKKMDRLNSEADGYRKERRRLDNLIGSRPSSGRELMGGLGLTAVPDRRHDQGRKHDKRR